VVALREFLELYTRLQESLCITLPRFPGKMATAKKDVFLHEHRRCQLEIWLQAVSRDPACLNSSYLCQFLAFSDEAIQKINCP